MSKIGSLVVELGLDDKISKRELGLLTAELDNFQNKLNKMNLGQLSALGTQLDKQLASVQNSINNTTNKIAKLKAEMNTTKGSKDTDLLSFNANSIAILEQTLSRLSNQESMIIAKSSLMADGIEAFGNITGPERLSMTLGEIGNALNEESSEILDNLGNIEDKIDDVGDKVENTGEGVSKGFNKGLKSLKMFSLGLMGLRSVMSLITSSANMYIQSNDTLSAKLEGAKQGLAQALAPAIELVVNLFVKLVHWIILAINYIGVFLNVIFGVRIGIVGASKDMKNLTKSTKSANKELNSLAGFDELNILSTDSGASAGGGMVAPDFTGVGLSDEDLAGLEKFREWLEVNKEPVKIMTILIGLLAGAFLLLGSSTALIMIALGLFAYLIYQVVKNWDDMSNAERVLAVLGIAILAIIALVLIFNAALLANPMTWIILAVIVAIGLLVAAFFVIRDNWDAIVSWFVNTFKGIMNWFKDLGKGIGDFFAGIWNGIKGGVDAVIGFVTKLINGIKTTFQNVWNFILGLLSKGGQIFTGLVDGIANIMKGVINAIIGGLNFIISKPLEFINGILNFIRNISFLGISPFKGLWKNNPIPVPQIPKLASGSSLYEETLFIGGEYPGARSNPEIVSPKSDIIDANKQAIAEMGGSGGKQPIKATVIVQIGGKEAGRKIIDLINDTQEDAGKTLLKI